MGSSSTSTSGWPDQLGGDVGPLALAAREGGDRHVGVVLQARARRAPRRPGGPARRPLTGRGHPQRGGVARACGRGRAGRGARRPGARRRCGRADPPSARSAPSSRRIPAVEREAAGEGPGQRGLAGAGRADDGDEPAPLDGEGHVVEQDPPAGGVGGDADDLEQRFGIGEERAAAVAAPRPGSRAMGCFRHARSIGQSARRTACGRTSRTDRRAGAAAAGR